MRIFKRGYHYNPHETKRMHSLAGVPLATFKQRAIAFSLDSLLILIVSSPIKLAHAIHKFAELSHGTDLHIDSEAHHVAKLFWMLCYFGLFVWATNGWTPGKRLMRIRVVSLTHEKISFWQSVERTLGYGASALEGGFGYIQYFLNPNHLCTHDRIAETIVVRAVRSAKASAPATEEVAEEAVEIV